MEDCRAQVATLSPNIFYFLTPHTHHPPDLLRILQISIMTRSRAPQSFSLIRSWRVIAAGVLIVVISSFGVPGLGGGFLASPTTTPPSTRLSVRPPLPCRIGRRVEDYRAQVATLSLNFFHFPLPLTLQPTESYPHASISWIDACRRDSSMEDH